VLSCPTCAAPQQVSSLAGVRSCCRIRAPRPIVNRRRPPLPPVMWRRSGHGADLRHGADPWRIAHDRQPASEASSGARRRTAADRPHSAVLDGPD
jgi:hypothetical protein